MTSYFIWKADPPARNADILIHQREDGAVGTIPISETSAEYRQYLEWVAAGNEPQPWEPPLA